MPLNTRQSTFVENDSNMFWLIFLKPLLMWILEVSCKHVRTFMSSLLHFSCDVLHDFELLCIYGIEILLRKTHVWQWTFSVLMIKGRKWSVCWGLDMLIFDGMFCSAAVWSMMIPKEKDLVTTVMAKQKSLRGIWDQHVHGHGQLIFLVIGLLSNGVRKFPRYVGTLVEDVGKRLEPNWLES